MKVLFVSSGNTGQVKTIVQNQANSVIRQGVEIEYFLINGKGVLGYLKNIKLLRCVLKLKNYQVIHAHYSLSGFIANFSRAKPLVVSLMGSDVKSRFVFRFLIKSFNFLFRWEKIIVKSEDMKKNLGIKNSVIIPNGVNLQHFFPQVNSACKKRLGWDTNLKHVVFAASEKRPEKKFLLANKAIELLNSNRICLHSFENINHEEIPVWLNAADVILLTSLWEGSPNVIKEAMACNKPIVATNVGDIEWLFGNEEGHFLTSFDPNDVAEKINLAIMFSVEKGSTNGRQRIINLGLDSDSVANRIIDIYKRVLRSN